MPKIFCNSGHYDDPATPWIDDPGAVFGSLTDGGLAMQVRDEIRKLKPEWVYVPDNLNLRQSIDWVNERAASDDLAIDIHMNFNQNFLIRGTEAYYAYSSKTAEIFSRKVAESLEIPNRGAKHDSESSAKSLGWLRLTKCNAVIVECAYLSSAADRLLLESPKFPKLAANGIIAAVDEWMSLSVPSKAVQTSVNELIIQLQKLIAELTKLLKQQTMKLGAIFKGRNNKD